MDDIKTKTDEELTELVKKGDKELYGQLVERYQTKLARYAYFLLGDHAKASDAVQEGFIKAYINLQGFNPKKKFASWLYRIVHNEAMNLVDKHKNTIILEPDVDFDGGYNPEDDYFRQELIDHMQECLEQLALIYREQLSLYYLDNKSYEEISDILRLPMGTVATRINRAKVIMKKICQTKMK